MFSGSYFPKAYFPGSYFPPESAGSLAAYAAIWFSATGTLAARVALSGIAQLTFTAQGDLDVLSTPVQPPDVVGTGSGAPAAGRRRKRRRRLKRHDEIDRMLVMDAVAKARREGHLRAISQVAASAEGITWYDEALDIAHELASSAPVPEEHLDKPTPAFTSEKRIDPKYGAFVSATRRDIVAELMQRSVALAQDTIEEIKARDAEHARINAERKRKREEDDMIALLLLMD